MPILEKSQPQPAAAVCVREVRVGVLPERLVESGFEFTHEDLEDCLRHVLGRGATAESKEASHA